MNFERSFNCDCSAAPYEEEPFTAGSVEGIDDLIIDEIYEIQKADVEENFWGSELDDTLALPDDSGRSEMTRSDYL